ncbi:DUF262 domain-containing protein [Mesorhizobium sp. dw_380]|uniref:GmrSD restriction endonuclease domain-containing protein n=1 Tax=Mesorhizobium sp. dw_380 TaxID=2812001 RepID=UPI001BDE61A3|nr:DUF262 domain-containing protein [Mesorhizobium sp. dw_380]
MAGKRLNLDALIKRENADTVTHGPGTIGQGGIPVSELAQGRLHFSLLRKPDFQRVTNDWDIDNVVTLIKSFRDGSLIPALILWKSEAGYTFVVDGAHRLSALIAWVNDDYGAGPISNKFFDGRIPRQQLEYHRECRKLVANIGTYADLSKALSDENPSPERIRWASNIGQPLYAQWVVGDAEIAEKSFLAINQRGIQISDTEKYMIIARKKPNVQAARALIRAATGHEYVSDFDLSTKEAISRVASNTYGIMFEPESAELGQSIEMPVAGKPYTAEALRITLELINFTNDIGALRAQEELPDDRDGKQTVRFLERAYGVVKYVAGSGNASLGLHPSVYFWGAAGKHHPSAFLAVVSFIQYLNFNKRLMEFCQHRAMFEEFLVRNHSIIKHILGKFGGWTKSVPTVLAMYKIILDDLRDGKDFDQIRSGIIADHRFSGLAELIELEGAPNKKVTRETSQTVRRREMLKTTLRCAICNARLPTTAFSDDHKRRVQDGGRGNEENLQLTHPYCNHGFKEYLVSEGLPFPTRPYFLAEAA